MIDYLKGADFSEYENLGLKKDVNIVTKFNREKRLIRNLEGLSDLYCRMA